VTFIVATVYDNPTLLSKDPAYLSNLMAQPMVDRERLLGDPERGGNWKIKPEAGKVFNRSWFGVVPAAPAGGITCRFFDLAATEKELKGNDPDYSASTLMRLVAGVYYILDCTAEQLGPAEVDRMFTNTAQQDHNRCKLEGSEYRLRWEVEPGSAGKREARRMSSMTAGIDSRGETAQGDKLLRAKPLAAQAEAGNVYLVEGAWNEQYLEHMHNQPDWPHDDIMDSASGAFNELSGMSSDRPASAAGRVIKAKSIFG
jgi:predicted phage terminase large subunit-like protein